jgi:hypothetical protein
MFRVKVQVASLAVDGSESGAGHMEVQHDHVRATIGVLTCQQNNVIMR